MGGGSSSLVAACTSHQMCSAAMCQTRWTWSYVIAHASQTACMVHGKAQTAAGGGGGAHTIPLAAKDQEIAPLRYASLLMSCVKRFRRY